jgi:hypothetical protein
MSVSAVAPMSHSAPPSSTHSAPPANRGGNAGVAQTAAPQAPHPPPKPGTGEKLDTLA